MRNMLKASDIIENIRNLRGFSTNREVAEFFGVGPSAVTDWVKRKGDVIPPKRLAEACRRFSIRWQWLSYGEGPPYEETVVDVASEIEIDPRDLELIERINCSPVLRKAVLELLELEEANVKLLTQLIGSLKATDPHDVDPQPAGNSVLITHRSH